MSEMSQLLARLQERASVPLGAHVQIADRCNHKCAHCYQVQGCKGELTTAEWLGILDRLADAGVLLLNISGGEATLRPDLIEILTHARARKFAVRLFTNGFRVDDALADQLAALHLMSVEISIYSHRADEHDRLTGVPGSWEGATGAMRRLGARGVRCTAKWVVTSYCTSTLAEMRQLTDELGATLQDSLSITAQETGDTVTTERCMLPVERLTSHIRQRERIEPMSREKLLEEHPCGACRSAVEVGPDGKYRICPALPTELGDARTDAIAVATGDERARFVAGLKWKDIPGCSECELLPWCGRCHGDALAHSGNMLGPYESACRLALASYSASIGASVAVRSDSRVGPYSIDSEGVLNSAGNESSPALTPTLSHSLRSREREPEAAASSSHSLRSRESESEFLSTSPSPAGAGEGRGEGRATTSPSPAGAGEGRGEGRATSSPSPAGAGEGRGEGRATTSPSPAGAGEGRGEGRASRKSSERRRLPTL